MIEPKNKIVEIRSELFQDFSINLLHKIYDYYLDSKTLSDSSDMYNHYNWCYTEVCNKFIMEDIDFKNNLELKSYFYSFYTHQVYKSVECTDKSSIDILKLHKFWRGIFSYKTQKVKNDMTIFIELYGIFNRTINENKKVLEKI